MSALATFSPLAHILQIYQQERFTESPLITITTFIVVTLSVASVFLLRTNTDGKIHDLEGIQLITAWTFFTKRWDLFAIILQELAVGCSGSAFFR